jgi:formamidopyrimidine-DNA glycosylase
MPELPEVETTLRGVLPHILNQRISRVVVREPRLRWPVSEGIEGLVGNKVTLGTRRAKYLLFQTGAGTLLIHLGMSGSLRVVEAATPWRKHDHFALELESGMTLRLHDPRRFGAVLLLDDPVAAHPLLRDLGPEPLGEAFTAEYLHIACMGKKAAIKSVIMDGHVVVGVGNIYACEALFMAGISPRKAAAKVTRPALERLIAAVREVLSASINQGGTTLRDFLRENGEPGYFKQSLRVYDREGEACKRCGATVKRVVLGQRSTYFCPKCQR